MPRRLIKTIIMLLPVLGLLLAASSAMALSLGVTPGKMDFTVRPGGTETQTLNVINQSHQDALFEVYVEGGNGGWFEITPEQFTLSAGEVRAVEIAVAPSLFTVPGDHQFDMCVVCLPPEAELTVGAGIRVPTNVQITEFPIMPLQWWLAAAALLLALIVGIIVGWRVRARYGY